MESKEPGTTQLYYYTVTTTLTTSTCRWPATAIYSPGHVINVSTPSSFSPTFIYYTNQRIRRPGAWLIFVSTSFIFILYSSCVEGLEMGSTMLG